MMISTKGRYALRVMIDLAQHDRSKYIPLKEIAARQNISEKEAKTVVQKNEKLRTDNYRYYTRRMWGAAGNFDLSLNTDLGEDYIESCIRGAMKL